METPTLEGGGRAILEDPSGRRARWMRWAGRAVFVLFLAWLLAVVAGGIGLLPVSGVPLTHAFRSSHEPSPFILPTPKQPSTADLRPAIPAATFTARLAKSKSKAPAAHARTHAHNTVVSHPRKKVAAHGKSATAPGHMKAKTAVAAPSQVPSTTTPHGRSTISPGQTKTTTSASPAKGKSATAPGHATTTTTVLVTTTTSTMTTTTTVTTPVHGQSANAPGQRNPVPLVHKK